MYVNFTIDFRWYELRGNVARSVLEDTIAPQEAIIVWLIAAFSIGRKRRKFLLVKYFYVYGTL